MERVDRGEAVDRQRFVEEHPDVATGLLAYFQTYDEVSGAWSRRATPPSPEGQRPFDYELLGEIARGGMGVVFKAHQVSLNRMVALKLIRAGALATDEDRRRFRAE